MSMTITEYKNVCEYLSQIIRDTKFFSHVFCVGGCVRDEIMRNNIKDIDIVIDLENGGIDFAKWLEEQQYTVGSVVVYPTYGTAMIRLKEFPDIELEFVHTRREQYKDVNSRNPETEYGTIKEDGLRRDLTINALYYNISSKEYIDPTNKGINDINNKIIRVTSTPDIVLVEDPLRILRIIRFASRYNWPIEKNTLQGMIDNVHRLSIISQERITDEFNKMLVCENVVTALTYIKDVGAMQYVIPELIDTFDMSQNKYHFGTVWQHTIKVMENCAKQTNDLTVRLSALLHDIGKIKTRSIDDKGQVHFIKHDIVGFDMCDIILRKMKYSNDIIKNVRFLIKNHMRTKQWGDKCERMKNKSLRKLQYECKTYDMFDKLMILIDSDNKSHSDDYCMNNQVNIIREKTQSMMLNNENMFGYKLPINGNDIMSFKKIKSGSNVKLYLDYLLKLAFNNPHITKEGCLKMIQNFNV